MVLRIWISSPALQPVGPPRGLRDHQRPQPTAAVALRGLQGAVLSPGLIGLEVDTVADGVAAQRQRGLHLDGVQWELLALTPAHACGRAVADPHERPGRAAVWAIASPETISNISPQPLRGKERLAGPLAGHRQRRGN